MHISDLTGVRGSSVGKEPACNAGDARDMGSTPRLGRSPWRRAWQPTPVFLPEESHGQRSLAGYSPWGRTESGTTEATERSAAHTEVFHEHTGHICPSLSFKPWATAFEKTQ